MAAIIIMTCSKVDMMKHQLQKQLTIFLSKLLQNSSQSSVTAICSSKSALALSLKIAFIIIITFSPLPLSVLTLQKAYLEYPSISAVWFPWQQICHMVPSLLQYHEVLLQYYY